MLLIPYLNFDGQCEAAFKFYEKCLGGKIEALVGPNDVPPQANMGDAFRGRIIHARLVFDGAVLLGSDTPAGQYEAPKGLSVSLLIKTAEEAERIFAALSEGGKIRMPIQKTFWSVRFGMFEDQFGIPWMINCEQAPE